MLKDNEIKEILNSLLSGGGGFGEIFLEKKRVNQITMEDDEIEDVNYGVNRGAGLRVTEDGCTHFVSDNDVSRENLLKLAGELAGQLDGEKATDCESFRERNLENPSSIEIDPEDVELKEKIEAVETANKSAREYDERVSQVKVLYKDQTQNVQIGNSEGINDTDERIRTMMYVVVVAKEDEKVFTGMEVAAGTKGFELFDEDSPEELAREAARVATLQLDARPAPAGSFTVVLSSEAGGTMIHEACGHGLEGDFVKQKLSVYSDKVGQKVASDLITVVDDGKIPGKRGTEKIDDEGKPSTRSVLIEDGVLKGFLHSRKSARETGSEPTGNGRRMSFRHLPVPRMRNTLIQPGKSDPEEIVQSVEKGILVSQMGGGQVDIVNGNFVFKIREGYIIEDGEIKEPIRGATLTGNGPEVLQEIDMVGNDLGYAAGACAKDGQRVPVSDAQPTIRIPEITVGGEVS